MLINKPSEFEHGDIFENEYRCKYIIVKNRSYTTKTGKPRNKFMLLGLSHYEIHNSMITFNKPLSLKELRLELINSNNSYTYLGKLEKLDITIRSTK